MPKEGTKKEGHEGPPGHGARGATGRPRALKPRVQPWTGKSLGLCISYFGR